MRAVILKSFAAEGGYVYIVSCRDERYAVRHIYILLPVKLEGSGFVCAPACADSDLYAARPAGLQRRTCSKNCFEGVRDALLRIDGLSAELIRLRVIHRLQLPLA